MTLFPRISTLPLLGWFAFTALVLNEEYYMVHVGSFKLSPFDLIFLAILTVKFARLAEPDAYKLPSGPVLGLMALTLLATLYLLVTAGHQDAIEVGDVVRDLRVVFYFLLVPLVCYKDIQTPDDYRKVHWFLVASGMAVALFMLGEQLIGFNLSNPVRNIRIGIWVIPFSVVSLLYFRPQLRIKPRRATLMILFMLVALVFSLNRSQYLQFAASVAVAMLLGKRVDAMRRGIVLFVPTLLAAIAAFTAIGYMDILISRVLSVEDLEYDSSYGARIQEYVGQMDFFRQAPIFGHGAGFRSWVMGENGFELSTFAHNSWSFYLMKFGIVGTTLIMLPCLLLLLFAMLRQYSDPTLELNRRYALACVPIYIFVDSLSGGLAYAPKTVFIGFLLCYALSLIANGQRTRMAATRAHADPAPRVMPAPLSGMAARRRLAALSPRALRHG